MKRINKNNVLFALFKDKDEVTLAEAVAIDRREADSKEKNIVWLRNNLHRWKKQGIAEPIYTSAYDPAPYKGARRRLAGIRLTVRGKQLLGKPVSHSDMTHMTLKDALIAVARLQKEHPDFEIRLEIKRKNEKKPIVIQ
jgi:hypothetical protein